MSGIKRSGISLEYVKNVEEVSDTLNKMIEQIKREKGIQSVDTF